MATIQNLIVEGQLLLSEEIRYNPDKLFFFVRLPEDLKKRLTKLGQKVVKGTSYKAEDNDHITLLYIPRFDTPVTPELRNKVLKAAKEVAAKSGPIQAKLQGWGLFDGAQGKNDEPSTAVVGLIDAPGLPNIHVGLQEALKPILGADRLKQNHGFTPHATFAYLPQGKRLPNMPVLEESFTITEFELSNDKYYPFKLGGK